MQPDVEHEPLPGDDALNGLEPGKLSAVELLQEIGSRLRALATKEIELARAELKSNVRRELASVKVLAVGGIAALCALHLLLVAAVFGLSRWWTPGHAALLLAGVAVVVAAIAGTIGWRERVRTPLERTRRTLKEDVEWTQDQIR